jgi:hypothetical protein
MLRHHSCSPSLPAASSTLMTTHMAVDMTNAITYTTSTSSSDEEHVDGVDPSHGGRGALIKSKTSICFCRMTTRVHGYRWWAFISVKKNDEVVERLSICKLDTCEPRRKKPMNNTNSSL